MKGIAKSKTGISDRIANAGIRDSQKTALERSTLGAGEGVIE